MSTRPRHELRRETFDREVAEFDDRQLPKVLDFEEHRFVSIERDSVTGATFVRGHKTLRGACGYLSRVVAGAERFVPERVLDLDSGELHELDVFAFVAPRVVDGVALLLPRFLALQARNAVLDNEQLTKLFDRALERRRH